MASAPDKTVNLQIDESVNLHICIETRLEWKESKQLQLSLQGKWINPLNNTSKLGRFKVKILLRMKHGSHLKNLEPLSSPIVWTV